MKSDSIKITILDDGALKMETDAISSANHGNCEIFLKEIARLAGGTSDVKRKGKHSHSHHEHEHGEADHTH